MTAACLWIIPTRGRPGNVARLHAALARHATCSDWVFAVDADDPELETMLDGPVPRAHFLVGPRQRIGALVDDVWFRMGGLYEAVGFMGDDHLPRTHWFDAFLLAELQPHDADDVLLARLPTVGYAWGDDKLIGPRFPSHVLAGATMLDAAGYLVPPGFDHLCFDVCWSDLGEALGVRHYRPDVVVEHMHPAAGKAPEDAGYLANNDTDTRAHDGAAYQLWKQGGRATDYGPTVARIKEHLHL